MGWGGVGLPYRLSRCAGWYFQVDVFTRLLRRETPTCAWVGRLSAHWVGGEEGQPTRLPLTTGDNYLYCVKMGQLSRCSKVLLSPLGVPPMPAQACSTQCHSQNCEVKRVLTTTDQRFHPPDSNKGVTPEVPLNGMGLCQVPPAPTSTPTPSIFPAPCIPPPPPAAGRGTSLTHFPQNPLGNKQQATRRTVQVLAHGHPFGCGERPHCGGLIKGWGGGRNTPDSWEPCASAEMIHSDDKLAFWGRQGRQINRSFTLSLMEKKLEKSDDQWPLLSPRAHEPGFQTPQFGLPIALEKSRARKLQVEA